VRLGIAVRALPHFVLRRTAARFTLSGHTSPTGGPARTAPPAEEGGFMRHGFAVSVVLAVALAVAPSAVGARAAQPVGATSFGTLVLGSGTFEVSNTPVRVDVLAFKASGGSVFGGYRVRSSSGTTTVVATCLRVDDDRALVGGIVIASPAPAEVGTQASVAIDDRGFFGAPLIDRVSLGSGPTAGLCPFSPAAIVGPWDVLESGDYFLFGGETG
jgi:hypothetical protein